MALVYHYMKHFANKTLMMKSSIILLCFLVALAYGGESDREENYDCSCVDGTGDCDKRYHCPGSETLCPVTCGKCEPTLPPYHEKKHTTTPEEKAKINNMCADEHNTYNGVHLIFDKDIAHYAQLRAEYVVEQEELDQLDNIHDQCKRNLFPELRWLVGNYMPFNVAMDKEKAFKRALKVWYDEKDSNGDQSHYEAMTGHSLVGCGVASNEKITRVVVWYGTPKSKSKFINDEL
eukprot:TCONS_00027126-protein